MLKTRIATIVDIPAIIKLTQTVFNAHVAPTYTNEGNTEFYKYLTPDAFKKRLEENHFILLAHLEEQLVGLIEIRNDDHVSLFFVDSSKQKQGIGRLLFNDAVKLAKKNNGKVKELSVNSSPNAVRAYEKLGFRTVESEKVSSGIRYVPMKMVLE